MARKTKEEKRIATLISTTAQNSLTGYQIDIMDIGHLTEAGEAAAAAGKSDEEIKAAILAARDKYAVKS